MNLLIIDPIVSALDLALRAQDAGHEVRLWHPKSKSADPNRVGEGLVTRVPEWQEWAKWADLILLTDNATYRADLEFLFAEGYPIVGASREAAQLELDRKHGQEILDEYGIETLPFQAFSDFDKAIEYVKKEDKAFVVKPWGGNADKALSFVSQSPEDMIFKLQHWRDGDKLKGEFILQEKADGIEMAVGGWFGPGGWNELKCENWEEKCFMNDGLGSNTGEMGTVVRYVKKSALSKRVLEPLEECLYELRYVGYCDVNCIITSNGNPMPTEITIRFGWPTTYIQTALHEGDPVKWLLDLIQGKDTLRASEKIAVGVMVAHGDYPKYTGKGVTGHPLRGISSKNENQLHPIHVMMGTAPVRIGPHNFKELTNLVTAGEEIFVAVGKGDTVRKAAKRAYQAAWGVTVPHNKMFRTDIGRRLMSEITTLQSYGYADGMSY